MEDLKQIERDLAIGLEQVKRDDENDGPQGDVIPRGDFIQDDVLNFLLGYKNKFIVGVLAKGLGEKAHDMLNNLYQVGDAERSLYKIVIQDFVRENFPEWEEKIAKFSSAALAGLAILELGRLHEAKTLIRAEMDLLKKQEKPEAA